MQQVQLSDSQVLRSITDFNSTAQFLMLMKGFSIGYLGIPLSHPKIEELISMMDIYYDWIEMGNISRQNVINIFLEPLKKVKSFHNKSGGHQDYINSISQLQDQVAELANKVIHNQNHFKNASQAYNPRQEILMSLNFIENQCMICSQIMYPEQVSILDCTHVYHYQCLYEHVKNSIESGQVIVRCPSQHCGIQLGQDQLLNFMTPDLHKKHEDFMMNQYVERNGTSTSWCPTPDCNFLFEFDPTISDFSCRNCHKRYCLKCRCEFHHNMSCMEYREFKGMNPQDQLFVNFARGAKFKQCPRCKFWVEKSLGCITMKCRCMQQFCYECGGVTCPHGSCSKNNLSNPFLNRRT